jgi:fibronectin-binding autotransporter adhesin
MNNLSLKLLGTAITFVIAAFQCTLFAQSTWVGSGTDLEDSANWDPAGIPADASTLIWNGTVLGNLNLDFSSTSVFGSNSGYRYNMTEDQIGSLTITNSNSLSGTMRLNPGATILLESGSGAFRIGSVSGSSNPIALLLGSGSAAQIYNFTNNSSNEAVLGSNVSISHGGGYHSATMDFGGTGNWIVSSSIGKIGSTGGGLGAVVKRGTGTLTLAGNNTLEFGQLLVYQGAVEFSSLQNLGTMATTAIRLGQDPLTGTLRYTGSDNVTVGRQIQIGNGPGAGGGRIESSGSGSLSFDAANFNALNTTSANRTLTLAGTNTGANTISGVIANNNGGSVALRRNMDFVR